MAVVEPNLVAAWIGILVGFVTGAGIGLFFHREAWLGGYPTWRRRLTRLGHVSFFGLAFVNLAFALSAPSIRADEASLVVPSRLLIVGAIAMPTVCFLSAWRKGLRHAFVVPVAALVGGVASVVWLLVRPR